MEFAACALFFDWRTFRKLRDQILVAEQGDRIGRIFAHGLIVYFVKFFEN
jgi:hypothetical protein